MTKLAPELTDTSGDTYYKVGTQLYPHASNTPVGIYQLTAAFHDNANKTKWTDSNQAGSLSLTITAVAPVANSVSAVLIKKTSSSSATADVCDSQTCTVDIAANGDITYTAGTQTELFGENDTNGGTEGAVKGKFAARPGYTDASAADSHANLNYTTLITVA